MTDGSPFQDCHRDSLQKRRVAENPASSPANAFWQRKQMTDSTSIEQWMANRKKKLLQHQGRHAVDQGPSCVVYFDRQGHQEILIYSSVLEFASWIGSFRQ